MTATSAHQSQTSDWGVWCKERTRGSRFDSRATMVAAVGNVRKYPARWSLTGLLISGFVVILLCASGCSVDERGSGPPTTVGLPEGPGEPGDVVAADELDEIAAADGSTLARAWDITYRSTNIDGADSLISGLLIVPTRPAEDMPLVVWAHPTVGTGDECAPSLMGPSSISNLEDFLAEGWTVVASDYEGVGSVGSHPYLVSLSEARAVLDSARAATRFDDGVSRDSPIVLWGFSQGGHAALAAAELAGKMAPELDIRGVAAAAPVADPAAFLERSLHPEQLGVAVAISHGAMLAEPSLEPEEAFTREGVELVESQPSSCIAETIAEANRPVSELIRVNPLELRPWAEVLREQRIGDSGIGVPVLLIHGELDEVVPVTESEELLGRLCERSEVVAMLVRQTDGHGVEPMPELQDWIRDRMNSVAARSDCP